MLRHIGGAADLVLVARHRHAILGHHQVRLDEIRAIGDGLAVGRQRVLRPQRTRAAVADHQHLLRQRRFVRLTIGSHHQCTRHHDGPA
jgi:hypothetical protein